MTTIRVPSEVDDAEAKTSQLGLLDLPTEIWTYIVELAVTEKTALKFYITYGIRRIESGVPAIAKTCCMLRVEGLKLFYTKNEIIIDGLFVSRHVEALGEWIKDRAKEGNWQLMKHVLVKRYLPYVAAKPILQRMFPGKKVEEGLVEHDGFRGVHRITVEDVDK